VGENAKQPSTSRIVLNVMFSLLIFNFPFVVFGLLWLLTVRNQFGPFTGVLREICLPVMGKVASPG
jgi:hypothetical protein